ncbi:metal-dependent hydrolase [Croceibacterium sp. TMG7-5b_MA50]|uniref:metal-dependent hydrolase n=1 Tax=Croceibacterium sp. TMG7-5b_MA50 TaxID=3121290 RepID=UPI0032214B63
MDNLTHSLVGALIGQAGLKRRTGLAMPALIIGANIPDIDAGCVLIGDMQHLALRRGLTHGPIAMIVLPLLLAGGLYAFDRWQAARGRRPASRLPVRFGWLWALATIACLSHPAFDWLNSYGVRLLEPFSSRWFHGDMIFIIDLWLWLGMGCATWLSVRRERQGGDWRRPARVMLAATLAYIGLNAAITYLAERHARMSEPYPLIAIANEMPVAFWRRDMIIGNGDGLWQVAGQRVGAMPLASCDLARARRQDRAVDAFLFWSRAPTILRDGSAFVLGDARFAGDLSRGRFTVRLPAGACQEQGAG